ncbi:hypothetical protein FB446DRAFT_706246 [Lentinula raphanica]|nr:hypothetical protein FB446DRAFT_706246 [Lentinula raphanica]
MAPSAASQLLAILLVATSISSSVLAAPTLARQCSLSVRQTPEFAGTPLQHRRDEHVDDLFRRNGADTIVSEESDGAHSALKDPEVFVSVDVEQRVELSKRGGRPMSSELRKGLSDEEVGIEPALLFSPVVVGFHSRAQLSKIVSDQNEIADRLDKIKQELEALIVPMHTLANLYQELDEILKRINVDEATIKRVYGPEGSMQVISDNQAKCNKLLRD